jgi:hypothetical protein
MERGAAVPGGKTVSLPVAETRMGFIAQEVAAVALEAVTVPKPGTDTPYGMAEGPLVALLARQ